MLAANVMYSVGGKVLSKDQVVPYLQGLNLADFTITGMVVKPNGPDMTLSYTLQLSSAGGPSRPSLPSASGNKSLRAGSSLPTPNNRKRSEGSASAQLYRVPHRSSSVRGLKKTAKPNHSSVQPQSTVSLPQCAGYPIPMRRLVPL